MNSRIILLILLLVSLSACQVNKRIYRPGYSLLSGKTNKQSEKNTSVENALVCTPDTSSEQPSKKETKNDVIKSDSVTSSPTENPVYCSNTNEVVLPQKIHSTSEKPISLQNNTNVVDSTDDEPKTHWASIASFCLALATFASFFFIFFGSAPLAFASIVLGIIGINKTNKNPDKFKNKVFAIIGMSLSIFALIMILLLMAVAIMLLPNS